MINTNVAFYAGNLTRDPELRVTRNGTSVTMISVAYNKPPYVSANGTKKECPPTYVEVEVWRKQAENVAKYLKKGSSVYVKGQWRVDQWLDKKVNGSDGKPLKRSACRLVAEDVQFGPKHNSATSKPAVATLPPAASTAAPKPAQDHNLDEDVPF